MRIVQFENGKFGVRRYWFFGWVYASLSDPHIFSWRKGYLQYCQGTEARSREVLAMLAGDKHTVIK